MQGPLGPRGLRGPRGLPGIIDDSNCIKKEEIEELKEKIKTLEQMVLAMWDAPGMPGFNQIMKELDDLNDQTVKDSTD